MKPMNNQRLRFVLLVLFVAASTIGCRMFQYREGNKMLRTAISLAEVKSIIHDSPFEDCKDRLVSLVRPGFRMELKEETSQLPLTASRFGGMPALPPELKWATFSDGEPLLFLGQLNLAEIPDFEWSPLPQRGMLYFYIGRDFIYPEENRNWVQVQYAADLGDLTLQPLPTGLAGENGFSFHQVTFALQYTIPGEESPFLAKAGLSEERRREYHEAIAKRWDSLFFAGKKSKPDHRILGYADELQSPMEAMYSVQRLYTSEEAVREVVARRGEVVVRDQILKDIGNWVLLMQLDSDFAMFGDNGLLYIWIHQDDLKELRFDRVRAEIQCH